jgi:hypothetical protein
MDTLSILSALSTLGARIEAKAGRLRIHAGDQSIPAGVIEAVRAAKSELLKLLGADGGTADPGKAPKMPMMPNVGTGEHLTAAPATRIEWSAGDWRTFLDERAGIAEHDGGLSRLDAEARAYEFAIGEWLRQHPQTSDPSAGCIWCNANRPGHPLLPYGVASIGHVWVHDCCWQPWHQHRRARAVAALAVCGIAK